MKKNLLHFDNDFVFLIVLFFFHIIIYNGTSHFTELPYGIHSWRQSMNFSMAQNFKENGHNIFNPSINNLLNDDNTGNLLLEFPLLQWLASFLPNEHLTYFRWIVFIFSSIGFLYGYKLVKSITNDTIISYCIMFIFLSVPIVLFYNANFNTDVPAISMSIASVYFWKKMMDTNQKIDGIIGAFFFTLSALLRLTAIILSLTFLLTIFLSANKIKKSLNFLFTILLSFLIIILWYFYQRNNNSYPVAIPFEISLSAATMEEIMKILLAFRDFQLNQFGFIFRNLISYVIIFFIIILYFNKLQDWLRKTILWGILGSFVYIFLWYKVFDVHDYYLMPVVPVFLIILASISNILVDILGIKKLRTLYIILTLFSIYHGYENFYLRNFSPLKYNLLTPKNEEDLMLWFKYDDESKWSKIRQLSVYQNNILEKHGIYQKDTVVCTFDQSPTYVLSLLNVKGWTLFNSDFSSINEFIRYAKRGAKFLIHYGDSPVVNDQKQDSIIRQNLVFSYYEIKFYNIQHLRKLYH